MDIVEFQSKNVIKTLHNFIVNQKHGVAICSHNKKMVLVPRENVVVDERLCSELGYDVINAFYSGGGAIVVSEGDFSFTQYGAHDNSFLYDFCNYFVKWLQARGLNAEYLDNDILVDGFKVCGTIITRQGQIDYSAGHIGINTNLEDIMKICTKPMNKIPKGLNEYGIQQEDIRNMFINFCNIFYSK